MLEKLRKKLMKMQNEVEKECYASDKLCRCRRKIADKSIEIILEHIIGKIENLQEKARGSIHIYDEYAQVVLWLDKVSKVIKEDLWEK